MKKAIFLSAILVLAIGVGSLYRAYGTAETIVMVVTDKDRLIDAGDCRHIIWTQTPDGPEVFENTDTWLWLKANSDAVQGGITTMTPCRVKVYGWRIPFLSIHRNVISATCDESYTEGE